MSRLASRIAKLEARKAKAVPREICVIGTRFPDRVELIDGVYHIRPYFTEETYAEFARNQQSRLLAELAEFAEQLNDSEDSHAHAESLPIVGKLNERAPLPPGTKGKRYALPNANIMIHQVLGGAEGPASDVEIRVKHMLKLKNVLNGILAKHTGRPIEQVEKDCDRDNFMSAEEAKNYGLVDQVVQSRKEIPGLAEKPPVIV